MKKLFNILVIISLAFLLTINVYAKDNDLVKVHVFYAEWCPNCQNLHKFLNELSEDKNYNKMFEVHYYRLDNEAKYGKNDDYEKNKEIYNKVRNYYGDKIDDHIPLFFIGESYDIGYSTEYGPDKIKKLIKDNYYDKDSKDIIQSIIDNKTESISDRELSKTKVIGLVVIAITIVIVAVILIIHFKKRL